jgi:hypothetical protein
VNIYKDALENRDKNKISALLNKNI